MTKNEERWQNFKDYYVKCMVFGECDPSYPAMNYVADRLEYNLEQRYWMAFLYGINYCVPTTYFMQCDFPDYENVDIPRLQKWWDTNKQKLIFQTDRAKVKNFDFFVRIFESYRDLIGDSQVATFDRFKDIDDPIDAYDAVYEFTSQIYYFGRFSLFNYLEALHELTDLKLHPSILDLKEAESCRNGMCYACNMDNQITMHHKKPKETIEFDVIQEKLFKVKQELQNENPEIDVNYWNLETVSCAQKKLFWKSRYYGYYIDRQLEELNYLEEQVRDGVEWSLLWDFRREFFDPWFLGELNGWKGIRKERMNIFKDTGRLVGFFEEEPPIPKQYSRKVTFPSIGNVYEE